MNTLHTYNASYSTNAYTVEIYLKCCRAKLTLTTHMLKIVHTLVPYVTTLTHNNTYYATVHTLPWYVHVIKSSLTLTTMLYNTVTLFPLTGVDIFAYLSYVNTY